MLQENETKPNLTERKIDDLWDSIKEFQSDNTQHMKVSLAQYHITIIQ